MHLFKAIWCSTLCRTMTHTIHMRLEGIKFAPQFHLYLIITVYLVKNLAWNNSEWVIISRESSKNLSSNIKWIEVIANWDGEILTDFLGINFKTLEEEVEMFWRSISRRICSIQSFVFLKNVYPDIGKFRFLVDVFGWETVKAMTKTMSCWNWHKFVTPTFTFLYILNIGD